MKEFTHPGWTLSDALDALFAHDQGATDSGVSDPGLMTAVSAYLVGLDDDEFRRVTAEYVRDHLLAPAAIRQGYGLADVLEFTEWLGRAFECDV